MQMVDITSMQPSIAESNTLCMIFFTSVNPFIRVLHQSLFGRELDQYRRNTLAFPREFEALLFSIYTLTVASLRPQIVEANFSRSKQTFLAQLRNAAQVALSNVDFFKTDKILTMQALLHYLVRLFTRAQHSLAKECDVELLF